MQLILNGVYLYLCAVRTTNWKCILKSKLKSNDQIERSHFNFGFFAIHLVWEKKLIELSDIQLYALRPKWNKCVWTQIKSERFCNGQWPHSRVLSWIIESELKTRKFHSRPANKSLGSSWLIYDHFEPNKFPNHRKFRFLTIWSHFDPYVIFTSHLQKISLKRNRRSHDQIVLNFEKYHLKL